jgi:hypothetical protein
MADPKDVSVAINDRFVTIDLRIEDEDLLNSIFAGLALYVRKGLPIKIRQSYVTFSGSQEIMTKFLTKTEHVARWSQETKQIISALRRRWKPMMSPRIAAFGRLQETSAHLSCPPKPILLPAFAWKLW